MNVATLARVPVVDIVGTMAGANRVGNGATVARYSGTGSRTPIA